MARGIIGAGNWILDKVKMVDRWPQEGELCNILSQQSSGGGGPCNVLFDLAAMGGDIPLYASGVLGRDGDGEALLEQIRANGIDDRHMCFSDAANTSNTDVMTVQSNGRRTFFHNRGANAEFGYEHVSRIEVPAKIFYLGYLLLLDELDRQDPEHGTIGARVLKEMRAKGYKTVVDIVSEDAGKFRKTVLPALKHVDCLVINEVEAGCCKGSQVRTADGSIVYEELVSAARYLLECGVNELVVIHFPEGAVVLEKDGTLHAAPSCHIEPGGIVGSVGAGDAFCAGFLYGYHEDLPVGESLAIASTSAWFNLQSPTATDGAPALSQIQAHLQDCALTPMEWSNQ
jgi:sugar/nucleoside kinase (ribokinase family)